MQIVTFKNQVAKSRPVLSIDYIGTVKIIASFTTEDGRYNAAHIHFSADEARDMARELLMYASKLDALETCASNGLTIAGE